MPEVAKIAVEVAGGTVPSRFHLTMVQRTARARAKRSARNGRDVTLRERTAPGTERWR